MAAPAHKTIKDLNGKWLIVGSARRYDLTSQHDDLLELQRTERRKANASPRIRLSPILPIRCSHCRASAG